MADHDYEVANMALSRLGAQGITNLSDGSKHANVVSMHYGRVRDEVLRRVNWTCAIKREDLTETDPLTDTLVPPNLTPYLYQYHMPDDCVRLIAINEREDQYIVEGNYLYSSQSPVTARYVRQLTNPADWDTLLLSTIVARLAAVIAVEITHKPELSALLSQEYTTLLETGRAKSLGEWKARPAPKPRWEDII